VAVLVELPNSRAGKWETRALDGGNVGCFVPAPLPLNPPLDLSQHGDLLEKANLALGRLDGITKLLPDPTLFIYNYVRKEAVLSSQIEGTQSSLSDLLLFEHDQVAGVPLDDVREVSNYVRAMEHGLARLRNEAGLPLSSRLLKEVHERLLADSRGGDKAPGTFRRSFVWLGSQRATRAVFVPPPAEYIDVLMTNLEHFLHDQPERTPTLIKAALAHAQFETIHPFLDGNGRVGRLLITLLLCAEGVLAEPMLYLSLYFKTNRQAYYQALQRVRSHGDWEGWLLFFLQGVFETAQQAFELAQQLTDMFERDRNRVQVLGARGGTMLQVLRFAREQVIFAAPEAANALAISVPSIRKAITSLEEFGIIVEITNKKKNRLWCYQEYVQRLNEGT